MRLPLAVSLGLLLFSAAAPATAQQTDFGDVADLFRSNPIDEGASWVLPGSVWFAGTAANNDGAMGYTSSGYFSLGGKARVHEDILQGLYTLEGTGHKVEETGRLFANIGAVRHQFIEPANLTWGFGVWYDIDNDRPSFSQFSHTFEQVSMTGYIKTDFGDAYFAGYVPIGRPTYIEGVLPNNTPFGRQTVATQRIDTALQGYEGLYRFRMPKLAALGGYFDIGGYAFESDVIDAFGGIKMQTGIGGNWPIQIDGQYTYDPVFSSAGWVRATIMLGNRNAPNRILERSIRNDHIVRFRRVLD